MLNTPISGASAQGHGREGRTGRSVRRPSKPRHVLSRQKIAKLVPEELHEWDINYGLPVLRGEILTGRYVYLAVKRHYDDLKNGHKRGLFFGPDYAWHIIKYIEGYFVHIKGPLANKPILLDPWQKFWTAVLYGWRRTDGRRRFTRGYEEVARKNGKSTWKGPQGAYLFSMVGEVGAEVYAVATTRAQALTVFKPAFDNLKKMVRRSAGIARSFKIFSGLNQEKIELDTSVFAPLPANAENLDGLNPYAILFDELHAQRTRDVWDVMESALGARTDPLLSAITTAGFILDGICVEQRTYLISVLEGARVDDSAFGYIYTIDDGDDPFDERNWIKANPGLGKSKTLEYMRTAAKKAAALPGALINFLTKDLNVWCNSFGGWFSKAIWDRGGKKKFTPDMLRGRRCYGGLDLASTRDLTAYALVFPPNEEGEDWYVLVWFWCPQEKIDTQEKSDSAAYRRWQAEGWLTGTPGNVTDYGPVKQRILQSIRDYDVVDIGFDRWNAQQLCNELIECGVPLVEVPQNTGGMYPGSRKLEELVYGELLQHGANPVLRWCAMNTTLLFDTNGNYRPNKKKSNENGRIDGIAATVVALSRAASVEENEYSDGFVALD